MACGSGRASDFTLINPEDDPRYRDYVDLLIELAGRRGVTQEAARTMVRTDTTVIAALALKRGDADAMICGLEGRFERHLRNVNLIIGAARRRQGPRPVGAVHADLAARRRPSSPTPMSPSTRSAEEIAEVTVLAAEEIRRFGIEPQGGAAVAFEFRLARFAERAEDARGGGDPEARRAGADQRRRNARRFGAFGDPAQPRLSAFDA